MAYLQSNFWSFYQNTGVDSFRWARPRLEFLVAAIDSCASKGASILTIGAGDCWLEFSLKQKGYNISTIDLDSTTVEKLRDSGITAFSGSLQSYSSEERFDIVVASEVLEHIAKSETNAAIKKMHSLLKENGKAIITVPCEEDLARSMVFCPNCLQSFHRYGHEQAFTKNGLSKVFTSWFSQVLVFEKMFIPFNQLSFGGKIYYFLKLTAWRLFRRRTNDLKLVLFAEK